MDEPQESSDAIDATQVAVWSAINQPICPEDLVIPMDLHVTLATLDALAAPTRGIPKSSTMYILFNNRFDHWSNPTGDNGEWTQDPYKSPVFLMKSQVAAFCREAKFPASVQAFEVSEDDCGKTPSDRRLWVLRQKDGDGSLGRVEGYELEIRTTAQRLCIDFQRTTEGAVAFVSALETSHPNLGMERRTGKLHVYRSSSEDEERDWTWLTFGEIAVDPLGDSVEDAVARIRG
jgi:hypothetical protein